MKWLLLFVLALAACGGGGNEQPPTVALYGDSLTAGVYYENGVRTQLTPTPVQRIAAYSGLTCLDYSAPGESVTAFYRRSDAASIVVLRYGMADAALSTPPAAFRQGLDAALAQLAGKRVILTSIPLVKDPALAARAAALNFIIAETGREVLFVPPGDLADEMHPTPEYADRLARVIGKYITGDNRSKE